MTSALVQPDPRLQRHAVGGTIQERDCGERGRGADDGGKVFVKEAFTLSRERFTPGRKDGARRAPAATPTKKATAPDAAGLACFSGTWQNASRAGNSCFA